MLLMGDEVRRSQAGNNNAYAQDNELGWFDWSALARHKDILTFVRKLIHFTSVLSVFQSECVSNTY